MIDLALGGDVAFGTTAAIVFGADGAGNPEDASSLTILDDLEGPAGRGGDLSVSAFNAALFGSSTFGVAGSTMLGQLTIAAGSGLTNAGQDVRAYFGYDGDDAFDVTLSADGLGTNIVTVGASCITLQAGHGDSAAGGDAELYVNDSVTVAGDISVLGGNGGAATGGASMLGFLDTAGTVTIGGALTLRSGANNTFTGDITGEGTLELESGDTLTLGAMGEESTVSIANLDGATPGDGHIALAAGSMVTIETTIGDG